MSTATSSAVAAVPLAIALLGGFFTLTEETITTARVRIATEALSLEPLGGPTTSKQRIWLKEHNPFGAPEARIPGHRTLIVRQGYSLSHNNIDLIADWVAFHLTPDYVAGTEERPGTSAFKPDPLLPKGRRAERSDYENWDGVFHRGHQVSSADSIGRGKAVVKESFYLSNMTPQSGKLNVSRWKSLEKRIRDLAVDRGDTWVITGPLFLDNNNDGLVEQLFIGANQVSIPTHYYKIVLSQSEDAANEFDIYAFVVPNNPWKKSLDEYLVSVDYIEQNTGIDFFPSMPEVQERNLEKIKQQTLW